MASSYYSAQLPLPPLRRCFQSACLVNAGMVLSMDVEGAYPNVSSDATPPTFAFVRKPTERECGGKDDRDVADV